MRVYIVDDEDMVRQDEYDIIAEVMKGADIHLCSSGEEVLEQVKKEPADVVFLDMHLDGMDGVSTAEELKKLCPDVNIIFCTAYDNYYREAMKLHASGYLLKPILAEDVRHEVMELRYQKKDAGGKMVRINCFGNFDVYLMDGTRMHFERSKAKEALAYLVNLHGNSCNLAELAAVLFEDQPYDKKRQQYIQKIVNSLMKTLKEYGVEEVVDKAYNSMAVRRELVECDYFAWLEKDSNNRYTVPEEYMEQYSWGLY